MPVKYKLVDAPDNHWGIQIEEGKYEGIIYRYGKVQFLGEDEEGNGIINFEYDVLESGLFTPEEIQGEEIDKIFGDILQELIIESLKEKQQNENTREGDSEESDPQ
jgi:hypothetical protein